MIIKSYIMDQLKEADLRGLSRVEALFKISKKLEIDHPVDPAEVDQWRLKMEREFLTKDLTMPFGKWLQFIVRRRVG